MKNSIRLLLVFLMFAVVAIPGVFATWQYSYSNDIEDKNTSFGVSVNEFIYKPEEVLPDEEADKVGGNHMILIRNILRETDYNINDGSKDVIHDYLNDVGVIYGNYNATSGGTLKKVLVGQDPSAANVQFMMVKKSDTEYHTYSFSQEDLDNARRNNFSLPDGYIEVYKTVMVYAENENGQKERTAPRAYIGKAKTGTCVAEKNKTVYSIIYGTWVET